jgi:hypothetical protein
MTGTSSPVSQAILGNVKSRNHLNIANRDAVLNEKNPAIPDCGRVS